ncbi:leucine-rich repeat extensin-like protein 4 [Lolium rigidum]|uniref:leucine-rich repeat extensin-like protein 4 n=1 Tax=Lolium rigidum TaxID=89674 RepID=UPI001F5D55E1|nr:leucine-rich repeat extensin-like protein 4 [Lolium rigidum]
MGLRHFHPLAMLRVDAVAVAVVLLLLLSSPSPTSQLSFSATFGPWINGASPPPSPPSPALTQSNGGQEYAALQALKAAISDDPHGALSSWQGSNVCAYKGVYCSAPPPGAAAAGAVVAGIDLNHASLKGTLPAAVSLLAHLTFIHLNSNRLGGAVPDTLGDLQYLTELDLSNNLFSGPFPASTLLIPSLVYLDLRFNGFSGELPEEVFAKNLDAVFLNNNQFEGSIPETLWSSPATVITLANNRLTGPVPTSYSYGGGGGRLREVLFLNNRLTGCVPEALGFLPCIEVLDLSSNLLSGHLPSTLSCLSGIEVLNIAHNQLTGELPELVCELRRITNLSVAFNFFSGISQGCDALAGRSVFDFAGNCVPGRGMQRPQPECDGAPGDAGLSCLRIPGSRPVACAEAAVSFGVGATFGGALPFGLSGGAGVGVTVTVP